MAAGDATHAPPAAEAQSLVESFCAVTSATPAEASFFLEGHNWALESAVRSFYDSTEVDADGPDPAPQPPPPPPAADGGAESEDEDYVGGGDKDDDDEDYVGEDEDEDPALIAASAAVDERRRPAKRRKSSHQARGANGSASGRGTVRTLSDLGGRKRGAGSDGDEDSEDDDWAPPPELSTGGERRSVLLVCQGLGCFASFLSRS
jgi:UBX domain-containing protein 1